jgi:hypothetical protein
MKMPRQQAGTFMHAELYFNQGLQANWEKRGAGLPQEKTRQA